MAAGSDPGMKMKSLRPFESRPSMGAAKGTGPLSKKIKSGKGSGQLGFGKRKGMSGVEV